MTLDRALASPHGGVHSEDGAAPVVAVEHEGWRVVFRFETASWKVDAVAFRPPEPTAMFKPLRQLPIAKLSVEARARAIAHRGFPVRSATKTRLSPFLQEGRGRGRSHAEYAGLALEYVLWRNHGGASPARRFTEEMGEEGGSIRQWHNRIKTAGELGLWEEIDGQVVLTDRGIRLAGGEHDHQNPDMVGQPVRPPENPPHMR